MSTSRSIYRKSEVDRSAYRDRLSEVAGVCLLALSLMVAVGLLSYSPDDPSWYFKETSRLTTENLIGPAGAFFSEALLQLLGLGAYSVAIFLGVAGWSRFWCHKHEASWSKNFGLVSMVLSLAGLLALSLQEVPFKGAILPAGGAVGHLLAVYLSSAIGEAGAFILLVTTLFAAIMVATRWSLSSAVKVVTTWQHAKSAELITAFSHFRESRRKVNLRKRVVKKHAKQALEISKDKTSRQDDPVARAEQAKSKPSRQEMLPFTPKKGRWTMPPFTILESRPEEVKLDDKELMERAKLLQQRCHEFAVEGQVIQIHPGPGSRRSSSSPMPGSSTTRSPRSRKTCV